MNNSINIGQLVLARFQESEYSTNIQQKKLKLLPSKKIANIMSISQGVYAYTVDKRLDKWFEPNMLVTHINGQPITMDPQVVSHTRYQLKCQQSIVPVSETHCLDNPQMRELEKEHGERTKVGTIIRSKILRQLYQVGMKLKHGIFHPILKNTAIDLCYKYVNIA